MVGTNRVRTRGCCTTERTAILTAWWLYHRIDPNAPVRLTMPERFLDVLEEIEASPEACDAELVGAYPGEYISQVPI